jgi:hypothetical protein
MPAMRAVAMSPAALEASSAAITATIGTAIRSTVTAAMGSIGAPIRASAASTETAAITTAITSAALRALEAGTRIGADAGEIFARRARVTRTARFAGQKNGVILNDSFDGWTVCRYRSRNGFSRNVLDGFVVREVGALGFGHLLAIFCWVIFLACFRMMFRVAGFRGKLRFARFRVLAVFTLFLFFFGFFFVVAVLLALSNFMRFVEGFGFVLVKIRATDESVGFGARLSFFVLGFDKASGERDGFFIAEGRSGIASRLGWRFFREMDLRSGFGSVFFRRGFRRRCFGFGFLIR